MVARVLIVTLALLCSIAAPSFAQADDAKALFLKANKLLDQGDLEGAADNYRAAYELSERAKILLNLGAVLAELGRNADFANVYQEYLDHPKRDPGRVPKIKSLVRELDVKVGRIKLVIAPDGDVTVDGKKVGKGPMLRIYRVEAGRHVVTATFATGAVTREVVTKVGTDITVTLRAPPDKKPVDDEPKEKPVVEVAPEPTYGEDRPIYKRAWVWTLTGAGAAATVGVLFGLKAKTAEDDYQALLGSSTPPSYTASKALEDDGKRYSTIANVAFISAGALAITSGVLMYFDLATEDETSAVAVSPMDGQGAMVSIRALRW